MAIYNGSAKIGQLRIGAQNFKEAWVGSTKVYSLPAKPTTPSNGVIYVTRNQVGTWGSGVTHSSNWGTTFGWAVADVGQTCTISNVVFSPRTTTLTVKFGSSTYRNGSFTLNGISVPITYTATDTGTITIPNSVPLGQPVTIGVRPSGSAKVMISNMSFNV